MSFLPCMKTIDCGPGKTKQKVGIEHDINKLVARFKKDGTLPRLSLSSGVVYDDMGVVVDLTNVPDYQEAHNRIASAREMFDAYPSVVRRHFANDVFQFVAFMDKLKSDPEKQRTAVALGIVEMKEVPKPSTPDPDKK